MSDQILVDYAVLAAVEADLTGAQRAISSALRSLDQALVPLLASWEGAGKEAYSIQQARWTTASDDLNSTLAAIHATIGAVNADYRQADQRVAAAWSGW